MNSYFTANIKRTLNKSYRYVTVFLVSMFLFGMCGELAQLYGGLTDSPISIINGMVGLGILLFGVFLGILEIYYVFSDDFKARMQQAAIGDGISRAKVIFAKYMEIVVYLLIDIAIMTVIFLGISFIMYTGVNEVILQRLFGFNLSLFITIITCMSLTMLFLYFKPNVLLGMLIYLVAMYLTQSAETINKLINRIPGIGSLHIGEYTMFYQCDLFGVRMMAGTFDSRSFIMVVVQVAVIIALTCWIFKKKELDF